MLFSQSNLYSVTTVPYVCHILHNNMKRSSAVYLLNSNIDSTHRRAKCHNQAPLGKVHRQIVFSRKVMYNLFRVCDLPVSPEEKRKKKININSSGKWKSTKSEDHQPSNESSMIRSPAKRLKTINPQRDSSCCCAEQVYKLSTMLKDNLENTINNPPITKTVYNLLFQMMFLVTKEAYQAGISIVFLTMQYTRLKSKAIYHPTFWPHLMS